MTWSRAGRGGRLARAALVAAGVALVPAVASAQWFGMAEGPIPPGQIVASLMRRGFLDIGRPRFDGAVYVVDGTNARGLRVRLVIDAFEGEVISRTRLDEALLPPRDVGRGRTARIEPDRPHPPEEMEEGLPPMAPGRAPNRGYVEREDLPPPPPMMQQRRSDLPPPVIEPRLGAGVNPPEMAPPARQARRPEGTPRSPTALPPGEPVAPVELRAERTKEKRPATAAAPKLPAKPREASPQTVPSGPAPALDPAGQAKPAEGQAQESPPARTVRVIEGVTPVVPKPAEPKTPAEAAKPAEPGSQVTVPPAALE